MSRPQLSIIVPTFNSEKTLARCLYSIAEQRWRNFEVLLMDGLSADRTVEIANAYTSGIPLMRLFSESDSGIYDAMNKGLALADGTWVYFLGSDDALFDADVLARLAKNFEAPVDFLYGNVQRMTTGHCEGRKFDNRDLFERTICHQAIFYRRELFQRLGHFNRDYKVCADWDFNIRCFGDRCRTLYVDEVVCKYDGGGFSSTTVDSTFLSQKLSVIARANRMSYWNKAFRSVRHEFFQAAGHAWAQRQFILAAHLGLVYAFHGALSGEALAKLKPYKKSNASRNP